MSIFLGGGGRGAGGRDWGPRTYVLTGPSKITLSFLYSSDFFIIITILQWYVLNEATMKCILKSFNGGSF